MLLLLNGPLGRPRCGMKDRSYTPLAGPGQDRERLTFLISRYPGRGLARREVDTAASQAAAAWDHSGLRLRQGRTGKADIEVRVCEDCLAAAPAGLPTT